MYEENNGHPPRVWNKDDFASFFAIANELNANQENPLELDEVLFSPILFFSSSSHMKTLLAKACYTCQGALVGVSAYFGGVVAQEILKSVSGKFTPLQGFVPAPPFPLQLSLPPINL